MLEVVFDAPCVGHPACRDDHGAADAVECNGLLCAPGVSHPRVIKRAVPLRAYLAHLAVEALRMPAEDLGCRYRQRAVDVDRELRYPPLLPEAMNLVQNVLSPAHSERRDHDIAPVVDGLVDDLCEPIRPVLSILVVAVSVCRLYQDVITSPKRRRVADDGLIGVSHIAGETKPHLLPPLAHRHLDRCGAEYVACINELHFDTLQDLIGPAVVYSSEARHALLGIPLRIYRLNWRSARSSPFPVRPFGLRFMYVSRIRQHDRAEIHRGVSCQRTAFEPGLIEPRYHPAVVYVSMSEKQDIDPLRIKRKGGSVLLIRIAGPLEEPAIDHDPP